MNGSISEIDYIDISQETIPAMFEESAGESIIIPVLAY
jgi:hypothetical protein